MTEQVTGGVELPDMDLLNHLDDIDLTTVDRSFPVLKEGTVFVTLEGFEPKENKAKTGHNLNIKVKLAQDWETREGKKMSSGFSWAETMSLVKTDNYNPAERLADIQLSALGKQQKGFKFADYLGRKCLVRLKIEDSKEYGDRHRIIRWLPVPRNTTGPLSTL